MTFRSYFCTKLSVSFRQEMIEIVIRMIENVLENSRLFAYNEKQEDVKYSEKNTEWD